jgi:hypothetical protein
MEVEDQVIPIERRIYAILGSIYCREYSRSKMLIENELNWDIFISIGEFRNSILCYILIESFYPVVKLICSQYNEPHKRTFIEYSREHLSIKDALVKTTLTKEQIRECLGIVYDNLDVFENF